MHLAFAGITLKGTFKLLCLGLPRMQNHKVKVGFFWLLKRLKYLFLSTSTLRFWCRILDNALIVILPQKSGFSITAYAPRPDSGHGANAAAQRVVFQKVSLPRIAWCSKLRTLFWGRSLAPFCVPFECSVIVSASSAWASRRQESPCSSLVRHPAAWN